MAADPDADREAKIRRASLAPNTHLMTELAAEDPVAAQAALEQASAMADRETIRRMDGGETVVAMITEEARIELRRWQGEWLMTCAPHARPSVSVKVSNSFAAAWIAEFGGGDV